MAPKKKLTKKEKARLEAERNEALRLEQEREKQRKLEEEKERKRREREEAELKHKQEIEENKIRRIQLKNSCEHFEKIEKEIKETILEIRKKKDWERYMRCNGLPNGYDPGDLRKYIHMWRLKMKDWNEKEQNWLLFANETSILTQDQSIPNTTIIYLRDQQPNLGDLYAQRVKEVLGILDEMDEAIADDTTLPESMRRDLFKLKDDFRSNLSTYIDEFSFKILSNIDRDMIMEGELISKHLYKSDVFKTELWTIRDIPQPELNPKQIERLEKGRTEIEFAELGISLSLPASIKCKDSAVRALWLGFDQFSDYSPSFKIPKFKNFFKGLNVDTATRKEWKKRKEILKDALKESNKKSKKEIIENEPAETGIIDVEKIYCEYEESLAQITLKETSVESLNLEKFDVNLRNHRIVAGIYCIDYLEQPMQDAKVNSKTIIRTIINPNNITRKDFYQPYKPPDPVLPGVRRLPEEIEAEIKIVEANLDKLVSLTIQLPEDVMWIEPPVVCRWETTEETNISVQLENCKFNADRQKPRKNRNKKSEMEVKTVVDFDMLNMPPGLDLIMLMEEFVVPRLPEGYTIKLTPISEDRRPSYLRRKSVANIDKSITSSIRNALIATNCARPLFPNITLNKKLIILPNPEAQIQEKPEHLMPNSPRKSYYFSQLLNDLDDLYEEQIPFVEKQIEAISETLSVSNVEEDTEAEPEMDFVGITFLKTADFPWNRKDEQPKPAESESESDGIDELEEDESSDDSESEEEPIGKWTTRDIHDAKFNEEKLAVQFKTGRLGWYGLAINWYSNIPFQTWEIKPDMKTGNSVIFNLTGSVVSIDVSIVDQGYTFNSFQGGISPIIQDALGTTMTLVELKNLLSRAAVNLFPEDDTFSYFENLKEKNPVMEYHLYTCIAEMGLTHNFTWSRWNSQAGRRACILLMREIIENRKVPFNSTLHVTPLKACIVDCTDVSSSFNPTGVKGMDFYADLHNLSQAHSHPISLQKQEKMSPILRHNVVELLRATRPLSFS